MIHRYGIEVGGDSRLLKRRSCTSEDRSQISRLGMAIEVFSDELLGESQQRIVAALHSTETSQTALDHLARPSLTEEADSGRQVSYHPLVAAGDDEVGERQAIVERYVWEGRREKGTRLLCRKRYFRVGARQLIS